MTCHVERENKDHGGTRHVSERAILAVDPPAPVALLIPCRLRQTPPNQALLEFLTHRIRCNKMVVFIHPVWGSLLCSYR